MTPERQKIFVDYMTYKAGIPGTIMSTTAVYAVLSFLEDADALTTRGYLKYRRLHSNYFVKHPAAAEGVCAFLTWRGVGFNRKKKEKAEDNIEPLVLKATLNERCERLLNSFIEWLPTKRDYSPNSISQFQIGMEQFFRYANEFNAENCRRFIAAIEANKRAPQTINLRINSLERFGEFLGKPVKLKRRKIMAKLSTENIPTKKEYEKLLEYLSGQPDKRCYFWVKILAGTGARWSEFVQFTWEDVLNGEVTLKGKGSKYRRFFFNAQLQKEVREFLYEHNYSGIMLISRWGRPMENRGFVGRLQRWGKACGIDKSKMHPHAFRHFFAKMYLSKNKDVVQLADLLGHESLDTTRLYLRKNYEEQKSDFNKNVTW